MLGRPVHVFESVDAKYDDRSFQTLEPENVPVELAFTRVKLSPVLLAPNMNGHGAIKVLCGL
ncbi:hypothetical protein ANMWB30_11690 [Arthrobacter sp. MWB30]|nr:hypothetical protein ANMWB30_11690 [Arthrobacter sp. MWB30]